MTLGNKSPVTKNYASRAERRSLRKERANERLKSALEVANILQEKVSVLSKAQKPVPKDTAEKIRAATAELQAAMRDLRVAEATRPRTI